ncbi:MAG: response regulator transcription factor [Flavipsychrobacter sp.]|nr:response regulator transcription factor [Flavipsychrobacter sp.]
MNNQLRAVIIDDEEGARITLASLLRQYCEGVSVVAACANVPEGVLAINRHNPDVVFLDVEMPDYNGFELLNFIKDITFEIVFATAYDKYSVRAFEVSAVDYLLKPLEIESLQNAVKKVQERRLLSNIKERLEVMKEAIREEEVRKIALPMSDGLLFIEVADIMMFEADRVYTNVFLRNGSRLLVSKPMRTFEEILQNRQIFFRPHRSYLLNINFIKKYNKGESTIIMENNLAIPLSREKKQDFEALLKELRLTK